MNKTLRFLLILSIIVLVFKGQAQLVQSYTTENSPLPFNTIRCLETSLSAIWIGTDQGLAKIENGSSWTVFNETNSGLLDNDIRALKNDGDSLLWVGTVQGGLYKYDGLTWSNYTPLNSGLGDFLVRAIDVDNTGDIWIATTEGIYIFDRTSWYSFTSDDGLLSNNITSICVGESTKYVGTINGGVLYFDIDNNYTNHTIISSELPDNSVLDIQIDSNGKVWLISPAAGLILDEGFGGPWNIFNSNNSPIESNSLLCMQHGMQGEIYIGTETNGIVTKFLNQYTHLNTGNSNLPDNHILCLKYDGNNTLWAGTFNGGLCRINELSHLSESIREKVTAYPNDISPGERLNFSEAISGDYFIINTLGAELKKGKLIHSTGLTIPKNIKTGIVFLHLTIGENNYTKKLLIQ